MQEFELRGTEELLTKLQGRIWSPTEAHCMESRAPDRSLGEGMSGLGGFTFLSNKICFGQKDGEKELSEAGGNFRCLSLSYQMFTSTS